MILRLMILLGICLALPAAPFYALPATAQTVEACSIDSPPAGCGALHALIVDQIVPNGAYVHTADPGCLNDARADIARALQAAMVASSPKLAIFSGPLSAAAAGPMDDYLRNQGGDIGRLFSPYAKNGALCTTLAGVIPVKATYVGYRIMATDSNNGNVFSKCQPNVDCPVGWSKFDGEPELAENGNIKVVSVSFKNWSGDRTRTARMIIFYTLPAGEVIATSM